MHYYFPTDFAKSMGRKISMFPEKELDEYPEGYTVKKSKRKKAKKELKSAEDLWGRMMEFQTLSISCSFKEAMVAYTGVEISKEQRKVLKLIHKTTVVWLKGKMSDNLLDKISASNSGREVKDLTQTMMMLMGIEGSEDGAGGNDKKFKALVIQTYEGEK